MTCSIKNNGGNEAQATPAPYESASTDPQAKSNEFEWEVTKETYPNGLRQSSVPPLSST
ncbi:hypothetical protein [Paenibacillus sp. FSL R10-2734]|uniref:hypothetical protein n=1 Tax=Paenibacillus sp. FSL R10-2734 TaxID=2954691 RepID=UPI0030DA016C